MSALCSFVLLLVVNYVLSIPLGLKPVCVWGGGGRTSHMSDVYLVLFMAQAVCEDPLYLRKMAFYSLPETGHDLDFFFGSAQHEVYGKDSNP